LRSLGAWAVGAALWASLLVLHGLFALLMFSAYHLACSTPMPVLRALPGIAAVSAILVATESVRQGDIDPLQLVFYVAVTLALGLFIAFMQAIHEQSEERGRLISELEQRGASWPSRTGGPARSPSGSAWRARSTTPWPRASQASSRSTRRRGRRSPRGRSSRFDDSTRSAERRARAWPRRAASSRRSVLTTYYTDSDIARAIDAGAIGYLLKDVPHEEISRAVRAAARGEPVLAPAVAARLMDSSRGAAGDALTGRELDVIQLAARGLSNSEIAQELYISATTVKAHLAHIYRKLGVNDRTAAVTTALERQIIRLEDA
jgi:DNA-binding NarL/FixJ family response regulator